MELRLMHLPSGHHYGLFTSEELERYADISRLMSARLSLENWQPGPPSLQEAKWVNELRQIEQRAIQRVNEAPL